MRFFNAVDLVNQLEWEKSLCKVGNLAKQLCLVDAVILNELGYLPFPAARCCFISLASFMKRHL